ncbi:unnamed protein product [Calypogeia fissa]
MEALQSSYAQFRKAKVAEYGLPPPPTPLQGESLEKAVEQKLGGGAAWKSHYPDGDSTGQAHEDRRGELVRWQKCWGETGFQCGAGRGNLPIRAHSGDSSGEGEQDGALATGDGAGDQPVLRKPSVA